MHALLEHLPRVERQRTIQLHVGPPRPNVLVGVPRGGFWRELLNSDAETYGGTGWGNLGGVEARPVPARDMPWTLTVTVPPLGCLFFGPE